MEFLYGFVSCGDSACMFTLTDRGQLMIGNRLYYLTNKGHFDTLWHHITTHGTENRS